MKEGEIGTKMKLGSYFTGSQRCHVSTLELIWPLLLGSTMFYQCHNRFLPPSNTPWVSESIVRSASSLKRNSCLARAGAAMNERKDSSEMNVLAPAESLQQCSSSFIVIICLEPRDLISQPR